MAGVLLRLPRLVFERILSGRGRGIHVGSSRSSRSSSRPAVATHHGRRRRRGSSSNVIVLDGIDGHGPSMSPSTENTNENKHNDTSNHTNNDTNEGTSVSADPSSGIVEPRPEVVAGVVGTLASKTLAASATGSSVKEVVLRAKTNVGQVGISAGNGASARITRRSDVSRSIAHKGGSVLHESETLKISRRAQTSNTLQASKSGPRGILTRLSVLSGEIRRARGRVAGAELGRITGTFGRPAFLGSGGKLALVATGLVGVITDSSSSELACLGIAAGVASAALYSTTITVLALLNNTVTTLVLSQQLDTTSVVNQTGGVERVSTDTGTDVTLGALGECGFSLARSRVHDPLSVGVTGRRGHGTAVILVDSTVGTSLGSAIVDGSEDVAQLVGPDLPLLRSLGHNVSSGNPGVTLLRSSSSTKHTEPG